MQELEYLRDEMNQRIIFSCDSYNKILGNLLLVWGGTLIIFTATQGKFSGGNGNIDMFWFFIIITVFFISIVIMYLPSQRVGENSDQIFKIAAYCAVFYEEKPKNAKDIKNFWELATFDMMVKELKEKRGKHSYTMNHEHVLLPIFAVFMMVFLLITFFSKESDCGIDIFDWGMVVICVAYILISVYLSWKMSEYSALKPEKWMNAKKKYFKSFIDYAVENKIYNPKDLLEKFDENFLTEIGVEIEKV
jgi:hypothetical protein